MLTVHHLQVSQSERIVWLCEELNLPYNLVLHKRSPMYSPQSIKDLHPLGAAPIIQDGSLTLAESAACIDYIIHMHGSGRLALSPGHKDYATYLYWFHFANGTLQPAIGRLMALSVAKVDPTQAYPARMLEKLKSYLQFMDDHLAAPGTTWLAGAEFTAADIMTVFTLTTMRTFYSLDLSAYENILAYIKRAGEREAFKRARSKGDPELEFYCQGPPPPNYIERISKM